MSKFFIDFLKKLNISDPAILSNIHGELESNFNESISILKECNNMIALKQPITDVELLNKYLTIQSDLVTILEAYHLGLAKST
jgi:hypothetical protein